MSIEVVDLTRDFDDDKGADSKDRKPGGLQIVTVHRIWKQGVSLDTKVEPVELCEILIHAPETGGNLAYAAMIDHAGILWQVLPLFKLGQHASIWNPVAVGIAVMGDPRLRALTVPQYNALVDVCAEMLPAIGKAPDDEVTYRGYTVPALCGHDEMPAGSGDPDKECPGRFLPMSKLRADVKEMIAAAAQQRLIAAGVRP